MRTLSFVTRLAFLAQPVLVACAVPPVLSAAAPAQQPRPLPRAAAKEAVTPSLTYTVEPAVVGHFSRTRVRLTFRGSAAGRSRLLLPTGWAGGDSEGKSVRHLHAVSRGARLVDTPAANVKEAVHPRGAEVTVQYDVEQAPPPGAESAPAPKPYIYHFGEALWVIPDWDRKEPVHIVVRWNNLPRGWVICNSYGSGDRQDIRDTLERFRHGTYLGGDFRLRPFRAGGKELTLAVRGRPAFADEALADLLRRLYAAEASFWGDDKFLYTLTVCYPTDAPAGNFGGEGRTNSFSVHVSARDGLGFGVKHLLAHELFHSWNPAQLRWDGEQSYWFTEGFTDYYAARILLRAGLCTLDDYLGFLNHALKAYYLSPARNYPYRRLMKERDNYESDRMIYTRGLLQALNWDADVRRASRDKHSLDDVLRALFRAARGEPKFTLTDRAVTAALWPHLGPAAERDLKRNVLGGGTIQPRADALGAYGCLREVATPTFALGFDAGSLGLRVITGVERGGNAYRAGLRDGQKVVAAGYAPGATDTPVELKVRDGGGEKLVRFYPRGPEAMVPQFRLKADLTAKQRAACLAWLGASPGPEGGGFVTEEVCFRSGGNLLAGVLHLPRGRGPHPAVVLIYGSEPVDRTYGGVGTALAHHFARHGFACLAWDRPGVGRSTGDWSAQTFRDRADEALAAVQYLRKRSDIRPDRVGVWGHSQGGTVAPLAASLSNRVAFLIEVSGWQGPAWQQDAVRVEAEMRADGCAEEDIRRAVAFARRRMELIRGTGPFEELEKAQRPVEKQSWFAYVHRCDRAHFQGGRRLVGYDSGPSWEKVHCPVLVIYGDRDKSSGPPGPLVALIRRGLDRAGNKDVTVKIFHDADHSLCRVPDAGPTKRGRRAGGRKHEGGPDFVPGYLDLMTSWLARRFGPGA